MGHNLPRHTVFEPKQKCDGCVAALEKEGRGIGGRWGLDLRKVRSICELGPGMSGYQGEACSSCCGRAVCTSARTVRQWEESRGMRDSSRGHLEFRNLPLRPTRESTTTCNPPLPAPPWILRLLVRAGGKDLRADSKASAGAHRNTKRGNNACFGRSSVALPVRLGVRTSKESESARSTHSLGTGQDVERKQVGEGHLPAGEGG